MMYPIELTTPMSKDLTDFGFQALATPQDVDHVLSATTGTTLLIVNSVCGCAAGNARPGVKMAIQQENKPETKNQKNISQEQ